MDARQLLLTPCLSIYQAACIHIRDHWWIIQSGGLHYNISVPVDQEQDAAEGSNGQLWQREDSPLFWNLGLCHADMEVHSIA